MFIVTLLAIHISYCLQPPQLTAQEVVRKTTDKMRGATSQAELIIKTVRPTWSREMKLKTWTKGEKYSMILIESPAKEKGVAFLKRGKEVWNWVPTLERSIKLPPSMMSQSVKELLSDLQVETWSELSAETKLMIDTTDSYSLIFIIIIMMALSFGIVNTMLMGVLERAKEIGMLLAVGMNRTRVFGMILTETIFLTITGTPLGILITWTIVYIYHGKGIDISSIGGMTMSEFGFSSMIYPAFPWEKMPTELLIVICAALLSSLIPAFKAIRMKPVEALQK